MCDNCTAKNTCNFYEKGADECVYDALAALAKTTRKDEKK